MSAIGTCRHFEIGDQCSLSGVKRTSQLHSVMFAFDSSGHSVALSKGWFAPVLWASRLRTDMRRREFITLLGGIAVAGVRPLYGHAQDTIKVWRVGILDTTSAKSANVEAFRSALSQLGYVEGQNLIIEYARAKAASNGSPNSRLSWWVLRSIL
jgi:hypothetical protein